MHKKITCIIIDDEPLAQELLRKYVGRLGFLELTAVHENAIEALDQMPAQKPDLIFLDVNMPETTGIEFMNTFSHHKPYVILTTAYSEYAVQGFDYNVTDFLLKPITFDRFVKAVNKVKEQMEFRQSQALPPKEERPFMAAEPLAPEKRTLLLKENKQFLNVPLDSVFLVEGMKDYLKVHTAGKTIITHMTMTRMEELLPQDFLRVNRSFIVRKSAIRAINGNTIEMANALHIPIGTRYRDSIKELATSGQL